MKRTLLTIGAGVLAAVIVQSIWFTLRAPHSADSRPGDLTWLKQELHLDDTQYARICEIHRTSSPRIAALAAQMSKMKTELDAFEQQRRSTGEIDFLEFARFVELRRAIDLECRESMHKVMTASAGQMTPEQRTRYYEMISPLIHETPPHN